MVPIIESLIWWKPADPGAVTITSEHLAADSRGRAQHWRLEEHRIFGRPAQAHVVGEYRVLEMPSHPKDLESYNPMAKDIDRALARSAGEAGALQFTRDYGPLGLELKYGPRDRNPISDAELVEDWLQEQETFAEMYSVALLVNGDRAEAIHDWLDAHREYGARHGAPVRGPFGDFAEATAGMSDVARGRDVLLRIIEAHCGGMRPLENAGQLSFRMTLLDVAWFQLLRTVVEEQSPMACEECRVLFFTSRNLKKGHARFCSDRCRQSVRRRKRRGQKRVRRKPKKR